MFRVSESASTLCVHVFSSGILDNLSGEEYH